MPIIPTVSTIKPHWEWLDIEDQDKMIKAINEGDRPPFKFQGKHGTRSGETRALKVKDFNFKRQSVKIRRTFTGKSSNILKEYTKNEDMREIPINEECIEELREMVQNKLPEAFIFINPRTGRPYSKRAYGDIWRKYRKQAGYETIKCHEGTRHSWASQRVSRGADLRRVGDILGHKDNKTTDQIYSHTNLKSLKAVMGIKEDKIIQLKKASPEQSPTSHQDHNSQK